MRPKRKRARPTQAAGAISSVLGNGDLLREILLRLDLPTCLVSAAAVSKWWLRQASDPAFLRRPRTLQVHWMPLTSMYGSIAQAAAMVIGNWSIPYACIRCSVILPILLG